MSDRGAPTVVFAFCTRDRPADLERACAALARSALASGSPLARVLVVDGGALEADVMARLRHTLAGAARETERLDASGPDGSLFRSRLLALRHARSIGADYVTFLDDDVEVDDDYVGRLVATLEREAPAALGGVDRLRPTPGRAARTWYRLAGLGSGDPGRLSASGFAESQWRWTRERAPFRSEFVSGCNMTLAVGVENGFAADGAAQHFRTYSLGEDIAWSGFAARMGPVLVDPDLRVWHHRSPSSREGRYEIGRQLVANTVWMRRQGVGPRSGIALGWSFAMLFAKGALSDLVRLVPRGLAAGMVAGLGEALRKR